MLYVYSLIALIFSFFSNLVLSESSQSSNCKANEPCLEKMSNFTKEKSLTESGKDSQSADFKSSLPSISKETAQTAKEETQSDNDKPIDLAQSSLRCRNAPWIEKAVVFQSVEAPQIEPLEQQYEDRQGLPYGEYDLVRKKSATVFVDIRGLRRLRRKSGHLKAFVNDKLFFEEDIRGNQTDFPIGLPMKANDPLDGVGGVTVRIYLIPDREPECYDENSFKVTVWETKKLDLRFARINNKNCKPLREYPLYQVGGYRTYEQSYNVSREQDLPYWPYSSVSKKAVENFQSSVEVKNYLPKLLPLAREDFRVYHNIIDLEGYCDNYPIRRYEPAFRKYSTSRGILEDINMLERQRIKQKGVENKMVAIVPKDYFPFHQANSFEKKDAIGATDIYGLVLHRREYEAHRNFLWWSWPSSKSGGSSNVLFVREDSYDDGTLSHELGHSLGQRKEFYDENQKCRDFKYDAEIKCNLYRIDKSFKFGKIEQKLFSIMHSGDNPINQKWIDRDTFQKAFVYLLTDENRRMAPNAPLNKDKAVSRDKAVKNDPIVIISGIYLKNENPEEEKFLYDPKIEIHEEGGLLTPFIEEGDIQIELRLEGKVIYTNRFSSSADIEFLKNGGESHKSYKLFAVPMTISLPLEYGADADYEIVIKQIMSGSKERALFSRKLQRSE